jgi:hypothetical protein
MGSAAERQVLGEPADAERVREAVAAKRRARAGRPPRPIITTSGTTRSRSSPLCMRRSGSRSLAGANFVTGLIAVGIVLPAGLASMKGNGTLVPSVPVLTGARVIVGLAAVLARSAVLAFGLGVWLRRGWVAIVVAVSLIALPYVVTAFPLLPDAVSEWLLRLTPAAGFAVKQTMEQYPQVTEHYAPSAGYFPLPPWAGLTVLCAYTAIIILITVGREPAEETDWR